MGVIGEFSGIIDRVGGKMRRAWSDGVSRLGWPAWLRSGELLATELLVREVPLHGVAVAFGCGIALYFSLPVEPPLTASAIIMLVLALYMVARPSKVPGGQARASLGRTLGSTLVIGLLIMCSGLLVAQFRAHNVAAPVVSYETYPVWLTATLKAIDHREDGSERLLLSELEARWPRGIDQPERLRISVRTKIDDVRPGDRVNLLAVLSPPPEPVLPSAYDFARTAWFSGIGGVGFAVSQVKRIERSPDWADESLGAAAHVDRLRDDIERRVRAVLPGDNGAVAVALIAGLKGSVPKHIAEDMRRAGLAHLLAISGLHMALVTGIIFFAVRGGLAAFPALALRWPLKRIAAVAAFLAALGYLLISGAGISTQRAFVMVSIVLLAALTDRQAISMRTVALAALVVLILTPEALLGASFQMSFAAVIGLIAGFEAYKAHVGSVRPGGSIPRRAAIYVWMLVVSTIIAELSIGPVAAFHFHRVPMFGLVGNIAAMPLMSFWIMPWGVLALALMPLGLENVALVPMGWGIDLMLSIAGNISAYPDAVMPISRWPTPAFGFIAAGFLLLTLMRHRGLRALGAVPLVIGALLIAASEDPDILIARDGKLFAIRGPDQLYYASTYRSGKFARRAWQESFAQESFQRWKELPGMACDSAGCIYEVPAKDREGEADEGDAMRIAFVTRGDAFGRDCRSATIVITALIAPGDCQRHADVFDAGRIADEGALMLYLDDGTETRIRSSAMARGNRPWVPGYNEAPRSNSNSDE